MYLILLLSAITSLISFDITETQLFKPLRKKMKKINPYLGKLFSCGHCFNHWVALVLVIIYHPRLFESFWLLDYFLTALVIAWLASFQWAFMCYLMKKEVK